MTLLRSVQPSSTTAAAVSSHEDSMPRTRIRLSPPSVATASGGRRCWRFRLGGFQVRGVPLLLQLELRRQAVEGRDVRWAHLFGSPLVEGALLFFRLRIQRVEYEDVRDRPCRHIVAADAGN